VRGKGRREGAGGGEEGEGVIWGDFSDKAKRVARSKGTKEQVQAKTRKRNNAFRSDTPAGQRIHMSSASYVFMDHPEILNFRVTNRDVPLDPQPSRRPLYDFWTNVCGPLR